MELLTIDSSVFVAALHPADVFHEDTEKFFRSLYEKDFQVVIPIWVVLEVGNSLIRLGAPKSSSELHEYFQTFQIVVLDDEFVEKAFLQMQKLRLKTGDAVIAATSAIYKTTLITWDETFRDAVKNSLLAFTPTEYMSEDLNG